MAQSKRTFLSGKMDIDIDDRLIQPGTYRRGQNISVLRSDSADVGAVENVRGNDEIDPGDLLLNESYVILGSVADRLNRKIYYFFVGPQTEGIYELDINDGIDKISRILEFSVSKQIFRFQTSHFITGANVVGDLLIWTDGLNPPRKINIERFRGSGNYYEASEDRNSEGGKEYTILPIRTNTGGVIRASKKSNKEGDDVRLLSDINPEYDGEGNAVINLQTDSFSSLGITTDPNIPEEQLAFPGDLISLGKRPPLRAPIVCAIRSDVKPNPGFNLQDKFVYASYRYKYRDGEVTPLSPFSSPIFVPSQFKTPDRDPGEFTSMMNSVSAAKIVVDVGSEEVIEVDVFITDGLGQTIRRLETIVKRGGAVDENGNATGEDIPSSTPYVRSEFQIVYDNNKTYSVLPADQASYIFSDIPLTAKAQEFAGNRLVFGNYTRNYPLTTINEEGAIITPEYDLKISTDRSGPRTITNTGGTRSIKTDRQMEVGIVYLDAEGRQSSVLASTKNSTAIPFERNGEEIKLDLDITSPAPYWAKYARPFYKDTIGSYYNVFPIEVIRDKFNRRLIMRLNPSEINKFDADASVVLKSTSKQVFDKRYEYKVVPYIQGGNNEGFALQPDDSGNLVLTGGVNDFTADFDLPFDIAQENTNNGFAEVPTTPERTENIIANVDENNNRPTTAGPYPLTTVPEGDVLDLMVTSATIDGFTANFTLDQSTKMITFGSGIVAGTDIVVKYTFKDPNIKVEESDDVYIALEPVDTTNGLDPFPVNNAFGDNEKFAIFETVDSTTGALEAAIYYEWGQTFRCLNGAHTNSEADVVMPGDSIQKLYEPKATCIVDDTEADGLVVNVNTLSTDVDSGTYTIQYERVIGAPETVTQKGIIYTRINEFSGTLTFTAKPELLAPLQILIIDELPAGKNIGDALVGDEGKVTLRLDYFNCWSFPAGIEEINIGSQWNKNRLSPGIRASAINDEYRRRDQIAHVIHSGIFNDDTNLNRLNEFNRSNNIEWELEISDGSIQKLHSRDTNLIVFQENKVKNIPINKNLIQSAGGDLTTTRSNNFFNTENSYEGEYGISRNPESFSTYGSRIYFADKDRGALLRLAGNGISEISQKGVESYVRDTIRNAGLIISSYDYNKDQAHFSFRNRPPQPEQGSNDGTFVISVESDESPLTACNIVLNPLDDRDASDLSCQRIFTRQEAYVYDDLPLKGLGLGDSVFFNKERTLAFNGGYRWFILKHKAVGTFGTTTYFPANNVTLLITDDGFISRIEYNCQENRPPRVPRELFAISQERFFSMEEACASGKVQGTAYHNGDNAEPTIGDLIYPSIEDGPVLAITGFYLITEGNEKYVIEVSNGLVTDKQDCKKLEKGRTMALGSYPIVIPYNTSPALRNQILCQNPWAEEVYWFDVEYELPKVGDVLYEDCITDNLVYGPWDAARNYEVVPSGGQYVYHNGSTYSVFAENRDSEPSATNTDWVRVSGYVMMVFNNGYYTTLGNDGTIITYGQCSEVRCFKNPDDFIEKSAGADAYEFRFDGIDARYTRSSTGTLPELVDQPIGILNAEINYVVNGRNRYPETGSLSVNAEDTNGEVFYSSILDNANVAEVIGDNDVKFIDLGPGSLFTLPAPDDSRYSVENPSDLFIDITSLCYRGVVNVTIGDPLDLIPDKPTVVIAASANSADTRVDINLTASVTEGTGTVDMYNWVLPPGLTLELGTLTSESITVSTSIPGTYEVSLTVTDTLLETGTNTTTLTYYNITDNIPPSTPVITGTTSGGLGAPGLSFTATATADTSINVNNAIASWEWGTSPITSDFGTPAPLVNTGALSGTGPNIGGITFTASGQGRQQLVLLVTDTQGFSSFRALELTYIKPPNVPPTVTITSDVDNIELGTGNITVSGTVSDTDGTIDAWAFDLENGLEVVSGNTSGSGTTVNDLVVTSSIEGLYTVRLTARDSDSEEVSQQLDLDFYVNNVAPTGTIAGPTSGNTEDTFNLTGTASDSDGTIATWQWLLPPNVNTTDIISGIGDVVGSVALSIPIRGTYTIQLRIVDNDGDDRYITHNITVEDPPPNVAPVINTITANPATIAAGSGTVALDATASDSDGTVESYLWSLPVALTTTDPVSGDSISGASVTIPTINVSGPQGTHTATLTVRDNDGDDTSQTVQVVFTAQGITPTVTVTRTGDESVPINQVVTFDGAATINTEGATQASWRWAVDENTTVTDSSGTELTGATLTAALEGTSPAIGTLYVRSNVESLRTVTLYVTDSADVTGSDSGIFTPSSGVLPDGIGQVFTSSMIVNDTALAGVCGGAGSAQTATDAAYYDDTLQTVQLFTDQTLQPSVAWDKGAGNFGVTPNATTGGAVITEVWAISDTGVVGTTTSRNCDVPHSFTLGYTSTNTSDAHRIACANPGSTPVFSDQPFINFDGDVPNPCTTLYTLNEAGTILSVANPGFYTNGEVVRQLINGVLQENQPSSCSLSVTAELNNGALPANTTISFSPTSARDTGLRPTTGTLTPENSYSITSTLSGVGNNSITSSSFVVTGNTPNIAPAGQTATDNGNGTYTYNGTGSTYTFAGVFEPIVSPIASIAYTAMTANVPNTYSAKLNITNNISNSTGGGLDQDTSLPDGAGYNNSVTITMRSGYCLDANTVFSALPSGVSANIASDGSYVVFSQSGNINAGNVNSLYTATATPGSCVVYGTATLTGTLSSSLSRGATIPTVSSTGIVGTTFSLSSDVQEISGWRLDNVSPTGGSSFNGTYTVAPRTKNQHFTGDALRYTISCYSGSTSDNACNDTNPSDFYSDSSTLGTSSNIYISPTSSVKRSSTWLRQTATTTRDWGGSSFGSDGECKESEIYSLVSITSNQSTTALACSGSESSNRLYSNNATLGSMSVLRTGPYASSPNASAGHYGQSNFTRYFNGSSWVGSASSCNVRVFDTSGSEVEITTSGSGNDANQQTKTGTFTIGGAAATIEFQVIPGNGNVQALAGVELAGTVLVRDSSGTNRFEGNFQTSIQSSYDFGGFRVSNQSFVLQNSRSLGDGTYSYTMTIDNDLLLQGESFPNGGRLFGTVRLNLI